MEEYIDKEDFLKLSKDSIADILRKRGTPKTLALIPDGTRKKNIIVDRIDPKSQKFLEHHTTANHEVLIKILKVFYDHGINAIFLPTVARGNLHRSDKYQELLINVALKTILKSEKWTDFFREYEIKVKVYGDLEYIFGLGYPQLKTWINDIEENTAAYTKRKFFLGLAYGQSVEEIRLSKMTVEFYEKFKKIPDRDDLLKLYYGDVIESVDILLRPSVIRDSDMQPILISGKAEMYFPVTSCLMITDRMFKEILHDYLYERTISHGLKEYSDGVNPDELDFMNKYFALNSNAVLGIGKRKKDGHFWYPLPQIRLPIKGGT